MPGVSRKQGIGSPDREIFAINWSKQLYKNADIAQTHIHACIEKLGWSLSTFSPHNHQNVIKYVSNAA